MAGGQEEDDFWLADCQCGNYSQKKLLAMAKERDMALDALETCSKWNRAYQNEITRIEQRPTPTESEEPRDAE